MHAHLLVIEDEELVRKPLIRALELEGYTAASATTGAEAVAAMKRREPQIALLDLGLPDIDGIDLLGKLKNDYPACEIIIITGQHDIDLAVRAMRIGAHDFLLKPVNMENLLLTIRRVVETRTLRQENRFLRDQYDSQFSLDNVGIHGPVLAQVFEEAARYAPRELPVLIMGESGTGKELVARHIHSHTAQNQRPGPFIAINCGALPGTLVESELFGYVGGAFTGASRKGQPGKVLSANGGTIFLDEVGELALPTQAKLLRFLQDKTFFPVGGTEEKRVDVKVICATNRNLADMVADGHFRRDLYFRINVGCIHIPPLRDRQSEVLPLARQFLSEFSRNYNKPHLNLTQGAIDILCHYGWPGNVRELRNFCERTVLLAPGPDLTPHAIEELGLHPHAAHLRSRIRAASAKSSLLEKPSPETLPESGIDLEEHINHLVRAAFELNRGNQSRTARYLGVTREVLRHRLKKLGLLPKQRQ